MIKNKKLYSKYGYFRRLCYDNIDLLNNFFKKKRRIKTYDNELLIVYYENGLWYEKTISAYRQNYETSYVNTEFKSNGLISEFFDAKCNIKKEIETYINLHKIINI